MIAKLVLKQNKYYCSKCLLWQPHLLPQCYFCNAIFTNYEDVIIKESVEDLPYEEDISNRTI